MTLEFDFEPAQPRASTPRTHAVAAEFRLEDPADVPVRRRLPLALVPPAPGEVMLLVGASGSGKSSLLRAVRRRAARQGTCVIDLRRIALPRDRPTLDVFDDEPIANSLRRLARVGLAEVWTWLRPPSQLSEGQRWRLRVAIALARAARSDRPVLIVCDEFAAVLDRLTA